MSGPSKQGPDPRLHPKAPAAAASFALPDSRAQAELLARLVLRLCEDLEVLAECRVACQENRTLMGQERAEPLGTVALVFRFTLDRLGQCWPALWAWAWSDAAQVGVALEHGSQAEQEHARAMAAPDADGKRRLLDLGGYLAASLEAALAEVGHADLLVRFETCQGLRPEARLGLNERAPEAHEASPWSFGTAPGVQAAGLGPSSPAGTASRAVPWLGARLEWRLGEQPPAPALLLLPQEALL
jgi:hypothetical protein